ncbi:MAG: tRNA-adenosine deaminase [Halanaerobium sp. 4-GBenrich]|uniref:tRNA-specific adenosine deaminase n=1 Tax=Halanaerobium congolense TaxID=54121 RepID=A0A1G8KQ38_9FIRM|nr:tRNA adenosine(34) deaminase TadA [Halanaerobium congolense]ODS50967.1 MAG: tRNA-adenosine deaminase [Halanaerobium sp. 4-GBenrich]PUU89251.1 MAG: tRNA-adenosine deaminase [Halanaerobium sp.]SDI45585.1 tRNA(adenine34) deaminase [Halanaerobium congolense]SET26400.1 tRNA(adenine34) deaminase [Halanaerobium congolense]
MEDDIKYMQMALAEARKAYQRAEVPIGAVVVCNDQVVGRGFNLREQTQDPTSHAEMIALREAAANEDSWRLEDCQLYVTLEPCPMCAGAILQSRIKRLVYGASDPKAGAVRSLYQLLDDNRFNHQVEVEAGVLQKESAQLLKDFFRELRQRKDG